MTRSRGGFLHYGWPLLAALLGAGCEDVAGEGEFCSLDDDCGSGLACEPSGGTCFSLNGTCEVDAFSCPGSSACNAGICCGDGQCLEGEQCYTDCSETCGDGICSELDGESCLNCPDDCPVCPLPECGDDRCELGESCRSCEDDCGECDIVCGDGECSPGEDCFDDCGGPSCPTLPLGIQTGAFPPYDCLPPADLTSVMIMADVNGFWGSSVTLCHVGPGNPCTGNACSQFLYGYVYYDYYFLDLLYQAAGQNNVAPAWMLAHEFAHEIQGHVFGVVQTSLAAELSADCFAGVYLGWRYCQGLEDQMDLDSVVSATCTLNSPWFDPTHGSCSDRIAATDLGFEAYLGGRDVLQVCSTLSY
jgi:hypothetical protein